ncbi:ATP-binding cassette domain-containing protein [Sciscionella sediminilitoris]|uniref:ATP-binding cassette domain-containing protein n=1 Tax=Sciscionella sediminilitoris TaxID=1445613 RepID=UPI001E4D5350|nr:ATP-binding cassette domain-containing protein [Sciscionella sp. SE31]
MISVDGMRKRYGAETALDGIRLEVAPGTVHGLLGPNGAGKTTVVRILTTLTAMDEGSALVDGIDVRAAPARVRERIGLVGQYSTVDEELTGWQNLELYARLHHLPARRARIRARELLERFGLGAAAGRRVRTYSGGMRRRLDIAASMVRAPGVLFLDEPTTGLDPRGRGQVWDCVRELVAEGTTVLLTTQYLDEADQLADRVTVLDRGRVIAEAAPRELKSRLGGDRIDVIVREPGKLERAGELLTAAIGAGVHLDPETNTASIGVTDRLAALDSLVRALRSAPVELADIELRQPTLDEAFLALNGDREGDHR